MGKILSIKEICGLLKIERKTVLRWIETGELKAFKLGSGGRLWRIRERDLQVFIGLQSKISQRRMNDDRKKG